MAKDFRLSNSNLNVDGFRVLTTGGNFTRFKANPICLWMHRRYMDDRDPLPIGRWENFRIEGDDLVAEPVLDTKDDFAIKIQDKIDQDIIRMCSIGIRVIEVSEDPKFLLPGQTRPTITKWELIECSLVDIGRHSEALRLYDENYKPVEGEMSFSLLPFLHENSPKINNMKMIALKLGLSESATEAEILSKISGLQADAVKVAELQNSLNTAQTALQDIKKAKVVSLVDGAIAAGKFTADKKEHFITLATANYEAASAIIEGMATVKPGQMIKPSVQNAVTGEVKTFSDLVKLGREELEKFKLENESEYKKLYAAEYGVNI